MILRYGGSNFFCFKEDFEIDLRLNKNCPEEISGGKDCSQVMCIKGANAAGKTNALKALSSIASFITSSFDEKPEHKLAIETYFDNKMPTHLFCEFRISQSDYRYELMLQESVVLEEKLTLISSNNKLLFLRKEKDFETDDTDFSELQSIPQVRLNASLISTAHQHEMNCIADIYKLFDLGHYSNVGPKGFDELMDDSDLSKFYFDNVEVLAFVTEQLNKFDTGIVEINIDFYEDSEGEKNYFPLFSFEVDSEIKKLRLHHQSSGTKRLYKLLAWCYVMINLNESLPFSPLMVMDELDLHLHSFILPELIKLIQEERNTQLIFTCQNDQILDSMGKYRTVLINKTENESYSYRLDELPSDLLRNNRPITPHYKKGSLGGVPDLG